MIEKELQRILNELKKDSGNKAHWREFLKLLDKALASITLNLKNKFRRHQDKVDDKVSEAKAFLIEKIFLKEDIPRNVVGFLYGIARNQLRNESRLYEKAKNALTVPENSPTIYRESNKLKLQYVFLDTIRDLSSPCREILEKVYVERKQLQEITEEVKLESFAKGREEFLENKDLMDELAEIAIIFQLYSHWAVYSETKKREALETEVRRELEKETDESFKEKIKALEILYERIKPGNKQELIDRKAFLRELVIKSREDLLEVFSGVSTKGRISQRIRTLKSEKLQVQRNRCLTNTNREMLNHLEGNSELEQKYYEKMFELIRVLDEPCRTILFEGYINSGNSIADLLAFLKKKFKSDITIINMTKEQLRKKKHKCLSGLNHAIFESISS